MRTLMRSILLTAALLLGVAAHAQWVGYQFISRSTDGTQVGGGGRAQVTPNGRFVVYVSTATQLVTPFTSGWQVFLFDRWKNTTELISQNDAGQFGDGTSDLPSISDDGCRVVFHSYASNLAAGAIGGTGHVYLRERCTSPARTRMVSTTAAGAVGNASSGPPRISGNGRYAAFHTYATNIVAYTGGGCCSTLRVVRKDLDSGAVTVVSLKSDATLGSGSHPDISRDGSRIVFYSSDWDLSLPGGKTAWDHFLWDAATPTTMTKVSTGSAGEEQINTPPAVTYDGQVHQPAISADGRFVAFSTTSGTLTPLGGNGKHQVYVKDTVSRTLTLVSVASNGALGDDSSNLLLRPQMSSNGHVVAFFSYANNLIASTAFIKPLLHDWTTGVTTLIADVAYPSTSYSIGLSPDPKGRYAVMDFGQTTLDPAFPSNLGVYLADFYPLLPAVTDITPILSLLLD